MPVVYRDMPCGTRRWNGVVGTGRGNTERAGTRRPSEGEAGWDGRGRWRVTTAFCMRLSVCKYVYVREYGLRARASTYESTESRRVSSIEEEGDGRSRAEFELLSLSPSLPLSLFLPLSIFFFFFLLFLRFFHYLLFFPSCLRHYPQLSSLPPLSSRGTRRIFDGSHDDHAEMITRDSRDARVYATRSQ